mgnify:FL=1
MGKTDLTNTNLGDVQDAVIKSIFKVLVRDIFQTPLYISSRFICSSIEITYNQVFYLEFNAI